MHGSGMNRVWEELCKRHRLRYLILFGSRVHGGKDGLSDWDFAAKFGRRPSMRELIELIADLVEAVGDDRVDLIVLDDAPPTLLFEALWKGKLLCLADREEYLWDRVKASSLYNEYTMVFKPMLVKKVFRNAK